MKRLRQTTENSPEYTDRQFDDVWTGKLGGVDEDRFKLLMSRYKRGAILDVGCFDSPIPIWYDTAIGIDYSPHTIDVLSKKYPKATYACKDALDTGFPPETFDYIVAGETIEHIEDIKDFVLEMMRILKKRGILAISTPFDEANNSKVSGQHVWSFIEADIIELFRGSGEVETSIYKEGSFTMIIAFITKW